MFQRLFPFLYRLSLVVARHRREGGSAACVRPDPALLYPFIQAPSSRGWRLFLYLNPKRITDMTASKTPAAPDVTLRQSARWLPADMDTPISLFLGMCHEHHGILLESAEVDGRWGRYSILACDFLLQAACRDGCWPSTPTTTACAPLPRSTGCPSRKACVRSCAACTSKNPRASRCRPSPAPCTAISATAWRASSTRSWKTACPKRTPTPALFCREPCSCSTTCTTGCARSASANTGT